MIAGLVAVYSAFVATGQVQLFATALAALFGMYALEKDRHLRRLAVLRGDIARITLVVANELMHSGALRSDRELLDVREALGRGAGRLAASLADVLPAHATRVRVTGPTGEVPVAAERDMSDRPVPDDPSVARDAARAGQPMKRDGEGGRTIIAVPMWRDDDIIGVLEAVSRPDERYVAADVALVDAFARGAVAALLVPPA
jgi:hypothetical protein